MSKASLREKVIEEVKLLPDEQLDDAFNLIHRFRLGLEARETDTIMSFAGAWRDMPEDDFDALLLELDKRRQDASRHRRHEADPA